MGMDFEQTDGKPTPAAVDVINALLTMQKLLRPVKKSADNPHFKSKYADLAALWEAAREAVHASGFVLTHAVLSGEKGLALKSTLWHTSGGGISTTMPLMFQTGNMQSLMSAMTYAKRGNLGCLTGLVTEDDDDDGNSAAQPQGGATKITTAPVQAPKPPAIPAPRVSSPQSVKADPVQATGKNADGSTKPHTLLAPGTTGEAKAFIDKLVGYLGERPISKLRASEWTAANFDVLEKMRVQAPVLYERFAAALQGVQSSSQAMD